MKGLSLFSGIGGLDLAFEWAGGEVVAMCEIDPYCQKVLRKHWPKIPIFGNVKELKGSDIKAVEIIYGGFPCQPFSFAGRRKGKGDDRYLWPEFSRLVREIKPRWIVAENVPGILRIAADEVCSDLKSQGYEVGIYDFEAAAVGAPHRRERIFFVAHSDSPRLQRSEQQGELREETGTQNATLTERPGSAFSTDTARSRCSSDISVRLQEAHAPVGVPCKWEPEPGVGGSINGFSDLLDRGGLSGEAKTRAYEILRNLRTDTISEAIQWTIRRFHGISQTEVLLAILCEYEENSYKSSVTLESGTITEEQMQNLWCTIEFARVSHRWQYKSQYAREYSNALRRLSYKMASLMPQAWQNGCWENGISRITHGLPHRVDRIKALGNAVVPQQAYPLFKAIIEVEKNDSRKIVV